MISTPPPDSHAFTDPAQGCEAEKLHLSGAIQGFGALLGLEPFPPYRITHASTNIADLLGPAAGDLLGQPAESSGCLDPHTFARLDSQPGQSLHLPGHTSMLGNCDLTLIRSQDAILIELEATRPCTAPIALQAMQKPFLSVPYQDSEVDAYHAALVDTVRDITGYDRVMVYRFHDDWSGEVIAEAAEPDLGRYLGLHFPASDIPAIARNLYLLNPYRLIADIHATPVAILGLDGSIPNLTWSNLRSVSPVHLQYLANMGIGASFSLPIIISKRLWGLVACHHRTAHCPSFEQRQACVAISRAYSLGLTSHLASRRLRIIDSLDRRIEGILETLGKYPDPLDGIGEAAPALMDTLAAEGFAMAVGDEVVTTGIGPDLTGISVLDRWFMSHQGEAVVATDCLEALFPDEKDMLQACSGVMAIKARLPRSGWVRLYWFRPAEPHEVTWAGNPDKPTLENTGATILSPRRSFEKWVELKTNLSRPWSNEERMTATKFRNTLMRWL